MHPRAQELIRILGLTPHPEGGAYREVFRAHSGPSAAGGATRPAATHIDFLLAAGEHSRWHRVAHDEIWHFYEGDPLDLAWIAPDWSRIEYRVVGIPDGERRPSAAVPAGCWQT